MNRRLQHLGHALDDGQPKAQPRGAIAIDLQPLEFLEDDVELRFRNARPRVMHLDPQHVAVAAAAHQHPALLRVLDGVGHEILQHAPQELAVGVECQPAGRNRELQSLLARGGPELDRQRLENVVDVEGLCLRLHRARVEAGNVKQRREDFLHRFERGVDVPNQLAILRALHALDKSGGEQSCGVQRLQDVMARRRDEARLRQVRRLGLGLGGGQLPVEARELRGALGHPAFERFVHPLQLLRCQHAFGGVDHGDHHAAIRHRAGAELEHVPGVAAPLAEHLMRERDLAHPVVHHALARRGAREEHAQHLGDRRSHPVEVAAQPEKFLQRRVPADQRHARLEHREPLVDVVDGRLEEIAIVLDRGRGVVQQLHGAAGVRRVPLQHQRDDEAGRGHANRTRQQMLGKADQPHVGLPTLHPDLPLLGTEALEGGMRALGPDVARHRVLQPVGGDCSAPQLEAGAGACLNVARHEGGGLHPLDRRGQAGERARDIGRHIGEQAPHHAMCQRVELHCEQRAGLEQADAPRPLLDEAAPDPAGIGEGRQQQGVDPDEEARGDPPHRTPRRRPLPHQPAEEGGCELRHCRKGEQAHLGQRHRGADHPVIGIGESENEDDGQTADQDQRLAHVLVYRSALHLAAQQQGNHQVVAHHDRQRDALDDHHGGGGRKPAEEGDEREERISRRDRQRQHEGIAVSPLGQQQEPRHRDRNDEDVDRHEIEREQPGGALDLAGVRILHRRHMELARQQDHRKGREQREGKPLPAVEPAGEQAPHLRVRRGAGEKRPHAPHHAEHHEGANAHEGQQFHH